MSSTPSHRQDFPLALRQLVPLLEALGEANEHIQKAAGFMQHWSDQELFPVKVQVRGVVAAAGRATALDRQKPRIPNAISFIPGAAHVDGSLIDALQGI